eukprot:4705961-Amphidinium_carterae.2
MGNLPPGGVPVPKPSPAKPSFASSAALDALLAFARSTGNEEAQSLVEKVEQTTEHMLVPPAHQVQRDHRLPNMLPRHSRDHLLLGDQQLLQPQPEEEAVVTA